MAIVYSTVLWDEQSETCIMMTRANTVSVELILNNGNRLRTIVWDEQSESVGRTK